jgi:hypothetical protein
MALRTHLGRPKTLYLITVFVLPAVAFYGCQTAPSEEAAASSYTKSEADPVASESPAATTTAVALEIVDLTDGTQQIAAAVTAAPEDLREASTVWGYGANGELVPIRQGTNGITCLADDPSDERFQVACYHDSLEPFMARGRTLRAEGMKGPDRMQKRHEEIEAGTLEMPLEPTTVYTLGGDLDIYDPATGTVDAEAGSRVYAVYTPYATEASTGLSTTPPVPGAPWIMRPGTPSSHIMVVPPKPALAEE